MSTLLFIFLLIVAVIFVALILLGSVAIIEALVSMPVDRERKEPRP